MSEQGKGVPFSTPFLVTETQMLLAEEKLYRGLCTWSIFYQDRLSTLRYMTINDDCEHDTFVETEKPEAHFRMCRPTREDALKHLAIANADKWGTLLQKDLNRGLKWL